MIIKKLQRKSLRHAGLLPLLTALLAACWVAGGARPAAAAGTYVVTSTLDDGSDGTLRSAIALADADPGAAVVFGPGVSGVISLQGAELDVSASMSISGPDAGGIQVDGGGALRLFNITSSAAQVEIYNMTLQNGSAFGDLSGPTGGDGGAVYNGGTLTLLNCAFTGSIASYGGAVFNVGALAVYHCSFSGNGAGGGGGGAVYNDTSGTLSGTGCSFTGNSAFYAGGLYNSGGMFLADCTIGGNSAVPGADGNSGFGAGLYNDGLMDMSACVINGNVAYGGDPATGNAGVGGVGGGLFNGNGATLSLVGCTSSGNQATPVVGGAGSGRSATGLGGGLDNQGAASLVEDIFYADIAAFSAEVVNDTAEGPDANLTASLCDIGGSSATPGVFGSDILDVDPLFVRPVHTGGPSDLGDLHLQTSSPCHGVGIASATTGTDHDGNTRPDPPSLGAYEYAFAPPVADPQGVATSQNTPVAVTLTGSDSDSLPLSFRVVSGPANGTLSGNAPDLTYTPNPGYLGADSFTFVANDGTLDSPPATVSLSVTPAVAQDVSGQVTVARGGYFFNRRRNLLQQVLTLTNTGPALLGPVVVAFDGLPEGVAVFRADGATQAALPAGSPYLVAVAAGGSLASGASVSVPVSFYDPAHVPAPYTPRVLAGNGD